MSSRKTIRQLGCRSAKAEIHIPHGPGCYGPENSLNLLLTEAGTDQSTGIVESPELSLAVKLRWLGRILEPLVSPNMCSKC